MRAYTIAVAALALECDTKWLDNLLSHHRVPGVARKKQGIQRQIPPDSLLIIGVARALIDSLAVPIGRALELSVQLVELQGSVDVPPVSLQIDVRRITSRLHDRLADAVEGAAHMPRGRPKTSQ